MPSPPTQITQWLLDTRNLWPATPSKPAKEQMAEFKSAASRALQLLSPEEQTAVLKYYHVRDAKMSLASCLLKHLAITKLCSVPWSESKISREKNGKPCYIPHPSSPSQTASQSQSQSPFPVPGAKTLAFNVSHQAGLVTLIATASTTSPILSLGTDIVCVNERDDHARCEKNGPGLFAFIDMHADVFAPSETQMLKMDVDQLGLEECVGLGGSARDRVARCQFRDRGVVWVWEGMDGLDGKASEGGGEGEVREVRIDARRVVDAKLRRFYALWCLREAFVKMTGEALLAEWLRELEFRGFKTPAAAAGEGGEGGELNGESLAPGEVVTRFEIYFKGGRVQDVAMELRALGRDYMVASAARVEEGEGEGKGEVPEVVFGGFVEISLETDLYPIAEETSITC